MVANRRGMFAELGLNRSKSLVGPLTTIGPAAPSRIASRNNAARLSALGRKRFRHDGRNRRGRAGADQQSNLFGDIANAGCNDRRRLDFIAQLQFFDLARVDLRQARASLSYFSVSSAVAAAWPCA